MSDPKPEPVLAEEPDVLEGIPVGYDLLQVLDLNPKRLRTSAVPLLMEFVVNPDTGPFLVSSTRSVLWIATETALRVGKVRAAVRAISDSGSFYREIIESIVEMGREAEWGNVQPRTPEGLAAAVSHLESYDLRENEILAHPDTKWEGFSAAASIVGGMPLVSAEWVPEGMAVVVPRDRTFVGFVVFVTASKGVAVVHNASRGVAVLT